MPSRPRPFFLTTVKIPPTICGSGQEASQGPQTPRGKLCRAQFSYWRSNICRTCKIQLFNCWDDGREMRFFVTSGHHMSVWRPFQCHSPHRAAAPPTHSKLSRVGDNKSRVSVLTVIIIISFRLFKNKLHKGQFGISSVGACTFHTLTLCPLGELAPICRKETRSHAPHHAAYAVEVSRSSRHVNRLPCPVRHTVSP